MSNTIEVKIISNVSEYKDLIKEAKLQALELNEVLKKIKDFKLEIGVIGSGK